MGKSRKTRIARKPPEIGTSRRYEQVPVNSPSEETTDYNTVVPALGDPRHERPPDVCGHITNVPTHLNVKLPAIGGHLPNADSHILVVRTCYNGQCKQMLHFGDHFNTKSLVARTLSCDRQFAQMSMLPSGDRMQYFISRVNVGMMNHVIAAVRPFGYICFTASRSKSHVFYVYY